ncbi:ATP-binding protein [Leclercia adecarboxylata]|uniref:ATP-binding protein n=2 Tax=Leclercia TaxID=83654 RepID=UPI00254B6D6D|nr:ATP-binding protein [Leclercia adecarboxylata]
MAIFNYTDEQALGKVISVDTSTVIINIDLPDNLKRLQVNRLVVLQSSKPGQHLIGLITQVTRKKILNNDLDDEQVEEINLCKVTLIGTLLDKSGVLNNVFRRTLESVPEIDANCFTLEGEYLTLFMRVLSNASAEGNALTLGKYTLDDNAIAYLNGNKFFQKHAFIGGSTGSGKSWTTAKIVEQMASLKFSNSIVFDLHGEYSPLQHENITHFKVAGPSEVESGGMISDGIIYLPYWLLSYEGLVSIMVDRSDQNAPNQAMIISREINKAKRDYLINAGEKDVLESFTIDSPVPFDIQALLKKLDEINSEMVEGSRGQKMGEFNGKLSRLIARLENKITDRRLGFLFNAGNDSLRFEWLSELTNYLFGSKLENKLGGVKIINFSEVPSDILPLMVSLVARLAFSLQQWTPSAERHPIALLCDEAHLYIPQKTNLDAADQISIGVFERIAKEGRKYGLSLVVISQRPSEVNKTILSQCSNFVSMRLTNADDQAVIRKLLPENLGGFSELLPMLDTGEALVVGDASLLPTRVRIDEPTNKPNSGTVDFWDEWQKETVEGRIKKAVINWRRQNLS